MFLRATKRKKDGKEHRYWSVVENLRSSSGSVYQKTLLYLGEFNDSQHAAWTKALEVFDADSGQTQTRRLSPADRWQVAQELAHDHSGGANGPSRRGLVADAGESVRGPGALNLRCRRTLLRQAKSAFQAGTARFDGSTAWVRRTCGPGPSSE